MSSPLPIVFRQLAELSVEDRALVEAALAVRERAFAPYSKFLVGAAIVTPAGKQFVGCNVENASYGLTNCAERTAIFSAVADGEQQFARLAIASAGGVSPCGACRQVLAEFAPQLSILLVDVQRPDQVAEVNMADLLPGRFIFEKKNFS
ncbi:cytidine deaminase [Anatilimnocola floriformis]|uniref:cytidine deaminase n=1 Tax=Anatilimnocola floriformis TaxID=2948575 RepID=UPI0020C4E019|nr:cytidine deaminase [Anatilimnocola floriformis]